MLENVDLAGLDILWQNKPELPVANDENKQLEELLKLKKIEVERLKVILENNIYKGKIMREHINDLCQTLSYKQQLFKTREHEVEMEMHTEKLLQREFSRFEQEIKNLNSEINSLKQRQAQREVFISEQKKKKDDLKTVIQWEEEALLQYLKKSAKVEEDNMALLKYTSEDDAKINELSVLVEKLSKEAYEKKTLLEDTNTEVLIIQSELDRIQEEFRNVYNERTNLISHWEKVVNQIQIRNKEINRLSENIKKLKEDQTDLKHMLREQKELVSIENIRNNKTELDIKEKDELASKLRNDYQNASQQKEDLKSQLSTTRNILNNILYKKHAAENSLRQIKMQMENRIKKISQVKENNLKLENDIDILSKETFDADHYTKELGNILCKETTKNQNLEKEIYLICKDVLSYSQEINELKNKEKFIDGQIKNKKTEIKNLNTKLIALDQIRIKKESEVYTIESNLQKLHQRVKKMAGETNEEERKQIESQRLSLLAELEEKKSSLSLLTEDLKTMTQKTNVCLKELNSNKRVNAELLDKIKFLEFYISNSQKSLKCCISRKQEVLVQECLEKFQIKRYQQLLTNKNKSVASLQKSNLEFENRTKERIAELKSCNELVEIEIRTEEEECRIVKRKYQESNEKNLKLHTKYKVILDALGVSEPGANAEAEMLIHAENEKRNFQHQRDSLLSNVLKNEDELCALKNTLWMINAANDHFHQALYPPNIDVEDSELLKNTEVEAQELTIELHSKKLECKSIEESLMVKKQTFELEQNRCKELENVANRKASECEILTKELSGLQIKIQRAEKNNSRLSLEVQNIGIEEDIRIHLLREIRRTISDLLFLAVENMPEVANKIRALYEEADLPMPSRARLPLSKFSSTTLTSRHSSDGSPLSSARSSLYSPSVVTVGSFSDIES